MIQRVVYDVVELQWLSVYLRRHRRNVSFHDTQCSKRTPQEQGHDGEGGETTCLPVGVSINHPKHV